MDEGVRLVILSDTHGRLPAAVEERCGGAVRIVHAGDVGGGGILERLESLAPVTAVAGNVDPPQAAPWRARFEAAGWRCLVQHIVWEGGEPSGEVCALLDREPADLVVFGHSHLPLCEQREGVVFLNPGSCGPSRFSRPRTFCEAFLCGKEGRFRVLDLEAPGGGRPLLEARFRRGGT